MGMWSRVPFLSPYTHLSLSVGWALTRLQVSWLAEFITRKRRCAAPTLHTHRQASLMVLRYTTVVPPLMLCIGPAHEAGLSTDTWRGHVPPRKKNDVYVITKSMSECVVSTFLHSLCETNELLQWIVVIIIIDQDWWYLVT